MMQLVDVLQLQLNEGGVTVLTVTGHSMYPTLRHKQDTVTLVKGQPKKHDVILYKRDNGAYVIHRVMKVGQSYICCGDNQWQKEPVRQDQILAVMEGYTRKGKYRTVRYRPYRLWVWFWSGIFPLRKPIVTVRQMLGKFYRRMKHEKHT